MVLSLSFYTTIKTKQATYRFIFSALNGGLAFEGYLEALSAETSYRTWRKYRRLRVEETLAGAARPSAQVEVLFDSLVEHAGSKYHGYVMQSIASLAKSSKKQRFFPTLVAQYHGLSKGGIDLLSSFGLLMTGVRSIGNVGEH